MGLLSLAKSNIGGKNNLIESYTSYLISKWHKDELAMNFAMKASMQNKGISLGLALPYVDQAANDKLCWN